MPVGWVLTFAGCVGVGFGFFCLAFFVLAIPASLAGFARCVFEAAVGDDSCCGHVYCVQWMVLSLF